MPVFAKAFTSYFSLQLPKEMSVILISWFRELKSQHLD